jgi:hypothetical protein
MKQDGGRAGGGYKTAFLTLARRSELSRLIISATRLQTIATVEPSSGISPNTKIQSGKPVARNLETEDARGRAVANPITPSGTITEEESPLE